MRVCQIIARRGAASAAWVVATLALALALVGEPSATAAGGPCSNEARRLEQVSAYLPNCRAYEQVSPIAKDAGEPSAVTVGLKEREIFEPTTGARAAADGERMAWVSEYSLPGLAGPSSSGLDYLSTRSKTKGEWTTEATVPPQSPQNGLLCPDLEGMVGWSANLTDGVLSDGDAQEHGGDEEAFFEQSFGCGHAEPALREADGAPIVEPKGFQNVFLRDSATGSYQLVNVTPITAPLPTPRKVNEFQPYFPPNFLAGSAQLNHVVFEDELPLTEEAERLTPEVETACKEAPKGRACWEGHDDLYVWSAGQQPAVRLVSVLPDGRPVEGEMAGSTRNAAQPGTPDKPTNVADYRHAISADGSRIFVEAEGKLYVRENAYAEQSKLDKAHETAANGEQCAEPEKACTIQLDLPEAGATGPGGGGTWLGANAEGTKVFFIDEAAAGLTKTTQVGSGANLYEYELPSGADRPGALIDLTPDAKAGVVGMSGVSEDGSDVYFVAKGKLTSGSDSVAGRSPEESEPSEGSDNLYVSNEGAIAFIATLSAEDLCDWTSDTGCNISEPSNPLLTGLTARVSGNGLYLAFNSTSQLTGYVNTDTVTGKADEEIFLYEVKGNRLACVSCNPNGAPFAGGAALDWAARPSTNAELKNAYPQRDLSEAGQVFFETPEALLPQQDTNGLRDAYAYEHGALHLISSGTSTAPSYLMDASANGSDVFFATAQKLLPRDTDSAYDIYDARVEGGLPEPPTPPPPCESEACKGVAGSAVVFSTPGSVTFAGPGDIVQTRELTKPKPKRTAQQKREAKLHRELQSCAKRYRHNVHKRAQCAHAARRILSRQQARASRRDRKGVGR
ncbi:MAG TPA: hypothetical protein VGY30_07890 [Solirubrobacteraceae bacterium]|jgi:hypothetical protein|nr:hypothetical protein [Solirubrobacteraceae bacterium]